jgi:hypothetical protein
MCRSPKFAAKRACCCGRERLVAEKHHRMSEQRLFDGVALFGVQRLSDIDATDLRAEGGA